MAITLLRFDMRAPAFASAAAGELYAAALEMAAFADEKGFDSITLSEHHGTDDGFLSSPVAMAGCILGRTRRIRVGVSALLLPLYDPLKLAEDIAILDVASAGRIGITVGLGYRPEEYEMFGRDFSRRGRIMDESLEALLRAWTAEPFEYRGRRVRVTPKPTTQPHPFVMVGGVGKPAARRAARFGLPFQPALNSPELFSLYRAECERLGSRPLLFPPGSGEMTFVSRDPERTWARIGPHLLHDAMTYAGWQPENQRSAVQSDATSVDELRREGKYRVRTPEECVAEARERGALASFVLFPLCGGLPPELGWESVELFANEVLPKLA